MELKFMDVEAKQSMTNRHNQGIVGSFGVPVD
jgi:hypothetical protein